jgi:hypothetical protein
MHLGQEIRDQPCRCGEVVWLLADAIVAMVALAGLVVVANQTLAPPAVEQAASEPVA